MIAVFLGAIFCEGVAERRESLYNSTYADCRKAQYADQHNYWLGGQKREMDSSPDEALIKELYAHFGLAYYNSDCLHRELCHVFALSPFTGPSGVTRPRLEERLSEAYSLTLGEVVGKLKGIVHDDFYILLDAANSRRNFLAHHFWFEKCHLMFTVEGVQGLIGELIADTAMFSQRDHEAREFSGARLQMLGITDELIAQGLKEVQAGYPGSPLMNKRKLKKVEIVVRAWNIPANNGGHILVLETDDGELWQFCDVGLGWSPFSEPGSNWKLEEKIQKHLPATINPRPKDAMPWNFEFQLKNKKKLWIRTKRETQSRIWGVSEMPPNPSLDRSAAR